MLQQGQKGRKTDDFLGDHLQEIMFEDRCMISSALWIVYNIISIMNYTEQKHSAILTN